jgi:hypothetical protein
MNCPSCNKPVDSSWTFCDACGSALGDEQYRGIGTGPAALATEPTSVPSMAEPPTGIGPAMAPGGERLTREPLGHWPGGPAPVEPLGASAAVSAALPQPTSLPGSPILLGYQERILRQYGAVQLRNREKGEGTLYVTDTRVVFYARAKGKGTQRGSALIQQTNVADITGMTAYVSRRISLGLVVFTCVLLLIGIPSLLTVPPVGLIFLLLAAVCIVALFGGAAKRGSTGVIINSRADGHSPISFGTFHTGRGLLGNLMHSLGGPFRAIFGAATVFDVLVSFPGQDTDNIINELGALILDLQTRGDLAYAHYGLGAGQRQPARGLS